MPDISNEPKLRELIDSLSRDLAAAQADIDAIDPENRVEDADMAWAHLAPGYVRYKEHPARIRGRIYVLTQAIERLSAVKTPEDLVTVYYDVALVNIYKAEYFSSDGRNEVGMHLRTELEALNQSLGISTTPDTQTSTQAKRVW